ncbi:MAG: TonB-dependent receptor [Calditrichaeota bacterium]|nr:TonB-dependent receptor [Calditrichota bacterium]
MSVRLEKTIIAGWLICQLLTVAAIAQNRTPGGNIKGTVTDRETHAALVGANVLLTGTGNGASTDADGNFVILDVPAGNYTLQFSYLGYEPFAQTDVIVKPGRSTFVDASLKISAVSAAEVTVSGGYFSQNDNQPVSSTGFSAEEIRRAPGSAGDVSRILMSLPAVAKVNDQSNSLIVRGGSPTENAFFVDNIEIPNINHFPTQGSSGGPIGLLNVDFIESVNFAAGGFSAAHGNRLSSVMEIEFREGNRDGLEAQLDLNFAGFGGIAEGPLPGNRGSWLLSVRRSFLDLLVDALDAGTDIAPRYGDVQGKLVFDINPSHQLQLLSITGDDHSESDLETARDNDMLAFGTQDYLENTGGINWRAIWGGHGYSNTSLAFTANRWEEDYRETVSDAQIVQNRSQENVAKFRNINYLRLSPKHALEFGIDAKYFFNDYRNVYGDYTDVLGNPVPGATLDSDFSAQSVGGFLSYVAKPAAKLTATLGVRTDYFSVGEQVQLSPRLALDYQLSERTSFSFATGVYRQQLPLLMLAQNPQLHDLDSPEATHFVFGTKYLLTENTRLSLEFYQKNYRHFPVDPTQPGLFLVDELYYGYGFFLNHSTVAGNAKALSRGVELLIQKKLVEKVYGLASASYFTSRYQNPGENWRNRVFDNRFTFSVEGGFKPNNRWEFSLRWIYAGGAPYTPFDLTTSRAQRRGVLDANRINTAQYPDYHSLNVRFDRRFLLQHTNIIFYLSVWNAYNRKNVAQYFWNATENAPDAISQWTLLPIFGLEVEF